MASQAGRRGEPLVAVYCATKAAVISLTQSAGLDLVRHRINVNAIAPGVVDGEHWDHVDSLFAKYENRPLGEKKKLVGEAVPYGRMGTPEDLTGMAIFLGKNYLDQTDRQDINQSVTVDVTVTDARSKLERLLFREHGSGADQGGARKPH